MYSKPEMTVNIADTLPSTARRGSVRKRIVDVHHLAHESNLQASEKTETRCDPLSRQSKTDKGELLWLHNLNRHKERSSKMQPK
ncbi:hypothetical protein EVAR_51294_1 [Eumeta japonica]|uniref:Uncharacterized protein n=1 Tax=Eumeta variegata TaxID=151549 RepID=A0A4C1XVE8_EUMVA|nr:hypothetical protein EVAR_51294_1 [Eumeta japonica]